MMTAKERLDRIRAKVERAKEHVRDLETEIRSFYSASPYAIGTKRDAETRKLIYFVANVSETPNKIVLIVGDAIQNLRSALDHLAYELVSVGTGKTPSAKIYFPIADDFAKYRDQHNRKVKGMRPSAIAAIDALKPYKGGNDTLWLIDKLNNIDKHRALLTAGSAFRSVDLGGHISREAQRFISDDPAHAGITFPPISAFFRPADRLYPLKQGHNLFIDGPDAEVDEQLQFRFEIVFNEQGIIEGKSLIETLQQMADYVDGLILPFEPHLT